MRRQTIFLIIAVFMVVAAIFVLPPILRRQGGASPILSSQPNDVAVPEQRSESNSNTDGTVKLLGVTENPNGFGLLARPVDPITLTNLPDHAPINFGHHYTYATSPDRKTLAVMTWPSGFGTGGELRFINLDTWTDTLANLRIDDQVSDLTFSADGKKLYWMIPTKHDPAHGMPRDYQLYQYDLDRRQLSTITQFPSSFMPWSQRLSSGKVAVFGIPTDPNNLAEDVPHLLIVDPSKNRIAADVRLDGVKAGQFYEPMTNATPTVQGESGQYVMYSPGLAWDLERGLLYIVHPDNDKVTVVDLAKGVAIGQTRMHPSQSFMERISDLLAPVAQAKGGPEITTRTVLSSNGKRLYVFKQKDEMGELKESSLRVIATDGMRELNHLDERVTDFSLTPDGKALLIVKGEIDNTYGFDMLVSRDVYVLDAETLQERVHVRVDQVDQLNFVGFSQDGRYVYLNGASAKWVEGSGWRDWQTTWQALDLNSHHRVSKVDTKGYYAVLLPILP